MSLTGTVYSLPANGQYGNGLVGRVINAGDFLGPEFYRFGNDLMLSSVPTSMYESTAETGISPADAAAQAGPYHGPFADKMVAGEPFAVWLGFIVLLIALKVFSERPSTLGGANPAYIRIGGYNILAVGLAAAVFVILMKAIFNKIRVPGLTEFANAL